MSKQRQVTRATRQTEADRLATANRAIREAAAAERARRERRRLRWSRLRLWQHGPGFRRHRERWGVVAIVVLLVLLVVFVFTRSLTAVLGTGLVCVLAAPVLAKILFDADHH